MTLPELQAAGADAATVWRYVKANEWIDDTQLRQWAAEHGLTPERVNNAIRILTTTSRLFAFEDTPISPVQPSDLTPPTLMAAAVNGNALNLVYSESLDPTSVPAKDDYAVMVDGANAAISSVTLAGSVVTISLSTPVQPGLPTTVAYTPGEKKLRDYTLNEAASLLDAPVENHTPLEVLRKPELLERAKALNVEGRSEMDAPALIEAIREAETARAG